MINHEIIFRLNQKEKILLQPTKPMDQLTRCYGVPMFFVRDSNKFRIDSDDIRSDMESLSSLLTQALAGKLKLHKSITNNIGSLHAQFVFYNFDRDMAQQAGLVIEENEWVGFKHVLWRYDIGV